jgi:membrane associated rhomboid family serine protease
VEALFSHPAASSGAQVTSQREPILNVNLPLAPLALAASIVGAYAAQSTMASDAFVEANAFSWLNLMDGNWQSLFISLFLHAGWDHALMNAVFILAFGTPVARYTGPGPRGATAFLLFYLVCGVLASLGFGFLHQHEIGGLVGASGAGAGLMGAAARLIGGRGDTGRVFSPVVLGMGGAVIAINLVVGFIGFMPGLGDGPVAWEAHIIGFVAGVLLAGFLPRRREA